MKNLLLCFLSESDRTSPDLLWRACVQWGPIVDRKTRRGALRAAVEAWVQERQHEPVINLHIKLARKDMVVVQVERPGTIIAFNRHTGMETSLGY